MAATLHCPACKTKHRTSSVRSWSCPACGWTRHSQAPAAVSVPPSTALVEPTPPNLRAELARLELDIEKVDLADLELAEAIFDLTNEFIERCLPMAHQAEGSSLIRRIKKAREPLAAQLKRSVLTPASQRTQLPPPLLYTDDA